MAFDMRLWRVDGTSLEKVDVAKLDREDRLEEWIEHDPSILGMKVALLGRQVQTPFGGRIDLLGLDEAGDCVVFELKRDRTPRDVVAQTLDYAAWVSELGYAELDSLAQKHRQKPLPLVYQETFVTTIPETVNANHSMVIVASELDDSSERIINYLAERHELNINAVFFRFFADHQTEHLGRCWLRDPVETAERAVSKKRTPWTGYWFVNVGEGDYRNWDDNIKYGYLSAGQGEVYSTSLRRLQPGARIFAYVKARGYVGYGVVTTEARPVADFYVNSMSKLLLDLPLKAPKVAANKDSPKMSEWAVAIDWKKTFSREDARAFKGMFSNPNIVCKIHDTETLNFLFDEFGVTAASE
ncbi:MAG: endonuclease NucS [Deltaproteobacteria bacterium]|nr:endonuclease NucS [Deltaproteobacteria bacterium]